MGLVAKTKEVIHEGFILALHAFPFSIAIGPIWNLSTKFTIFAWRSFAIAQSSTTGFLLMIFPGLNLLVGVGSDLTSLFYGMQATAYGVGSIVARRNGYSISHLSKSDYIDILAVWAGASEFIEDSQAKLVLYDVFEDKTVTKASVKGAVKSTTFVASGMVSKKMGIPISTPLLEKVVAKISTKLTAKSTAFIPGIGAAVNGAVNAWFINSITNSAKQYYIAKYEGRSVK